MIQITTPQAQANLQKVDGTLAVTHLLLVNGRSACGYPAGSAPSWPAGHFWARLRNGHLVSCPKCQRLLPEIKALQSREG
jgi:hypothetical protein